jgi:NADPH2:quinone reductase
LGAAACLDYTTQDVLADAERIAGRKLDAIADFVGGETLAWSLAVIRPYGRIASSVGVRGDLDKLLDLNLTLHGYWFVPSKGG